MGLVFGKVGARVADAPPLDPPLPSAMEPGSPAGAESTTLAEVNSVSPAEKHKASTELQKQTFWIKVKVAKSSIAQFLDKKTFPTDCKGATEKNFKNLSHQLLIHLPREGLFLAEISLDKFATKTNVLFDITDKRMNIYISKLETFEKENMKTGGSKGLSHKVSKKIFAENSLEAIGYIDLPMYVDNDHMSFYLDDEDVFHIEAEIKGTLSRNLATIRGNSTENQEPSAWRPQGIKVGSVTTLGIFQPGALFRKRRFSRKIKKKECVWQIGFV